MATTASAPKPTTRIPTPADFAHLLPTLTVQLHFPTPPESTSAILLLFHGLGDTEAPFHRFAQGMNLPGVLALSVRGTSPLPPSLVVSSSFEETKNARGGSHHYQWGDDLRLFGDGGGERLDDDPGFEKAAGKVLDVLVRQVLVERCGWETEDVLLFGFGQGGGFALGLASRLRLGLEEAVSAVSAVSAGGGGGGSGRVQEVVEDDGDGDMASSSGRKNKKKKSGDRDGEEKKKKNAFKGVVSIGGALPASMVPTISGRPKATTPVLVCCGGESDAVDDGAVDVLRGEFEEVQVERWKRAGDAMPGNREEMLPIMRFFADRLRGPAAGGLVF